MKKICNGALVVALCVGSLIPAGCNSIKNTWNSMSQSGQGATAGAGIGGAVGAGIGAIIGGGKGTWIGALLGSAIGAGTGALVGNQMDKQKKELEEQLATLQAQTDKNSQDIDAIKVETVKDCNNLDAIKLVMGNSVLFQTGQYTLSAEAQAALSRVAYNLKQFPDTDITVIGYTDNTGSEELNMNLSKQRADAVMNYLISQGVAASRIKAIGDGWNNPVATNDTPEGRAQNRRVEIYITANEQMIKAAEAAS